MVILTIDMMNKWRIIPGFEGYEICVDTKEGRCRNIKTGKELSVNPDKKGRINWNIKGHTKQAAVWIALTYPELICNEWFDGAEIDHIDTDKSNNFPSNLHWVDRKGNQNNPITKQNMSNAKLGGKLSDDHKKKLSESHKNILINRCDLSLLVVKMDTENNVLKIYPSIREAERETGILHSSISNCLHGKSKTSGGYKWRYYVQE